MTNTDHHTRRSELKLERTLYHLKARTDHAPRVLNTLTRGWFAFCPCGWEYDTNSNSPLAGLLAQMKADDHANT